MFRVESHAGMVWVFQAFKDMYGEHVLVGKLYDLFIRVLFVVLGMLMDKEIPWRLRYPHMGVLLLWFSSDSNTTSKYAGLRAEITIIGIGSSLFWVDPGTSFMMIVWVISVAIGVE
jgi:hypothetical protein